METRFSFYSRVRSRGTNFALTRLFFKSSVRMVCTDPNERFYYSAISWMVKRLFPRMTVLIAAMLSSLREVDRRPLLSSSFRDSCPSLSLPNHLQTVLFVTAVSPYTSCCSLWVPVADLLSLKQNSMFARCSKFDILVNLPAATKTSSLHGWLRSHHSH